MASLVTASPYKNEINKLCSQIDNLRFDSKNICVGGGGLGAGSSDLPGLQNELKLRENTGLVSVDENSLFLLEDLNKLSNRLKVLENYMGRTDGKCGNDNQNCAAKIALLVTELKANIEMIKNKGQAVYDSLVCEENTLNSEINSLIGHIDSLKRAETELKPITKKNDSVLKYSTDKTKLKQDESGRVGKRSPALKMSDVTIWSPKDYVALGKICKSRNLYDDEKILLELCSKKLPHKCELEIMIYIKKHLKESKKKEAIKQKISKWREAKELYERENKNFPEESDIGSSKRERPKTACLRHHKIKCNPSVDRLSKPRPKTAPAHNAKVDIHKTGRYSQIYSAKERANIKEQLHKYKEQKQVLYMETAKAFKSPKVKKVSFKKFQERDKEFVSSRMKLTSSKKSIENKISVIKTKVNDRPPQESTLMKPTLSFISADISRCVKSPRKSFSARYNDVDAIPKRKIPNWRNMK